MGIVNIKIGLIYLTVLLISVQFSAVGLLYIYEQLRIAIMIIVLLLGVFSLKSYKQLLKYHKVIFFPVLIVGITTSILMIFTGVSYGKVDYTSIRDVLLVIVLLGISITTPMREQQMQLLQKLFIYSITISALTIPLVIGSGFVIEEVYLPVPKNQLASLFVSAIIVGCYLNYREKRKLRKFWLTVSIFALLVVILVLRGRSAFVALTFGGVLYLIFVIRRVKFLIYGVIVLILTSPLYLSYIYSSFFLNQNVNDINSLTSGRTAVYVEALNILKKSPFFGGMFTDSNTSYIVHNYLLKNLVDYGLVSIGLFYLYFYLLKHSFRGLYAGSSNLVVYSILVLMLFVLSLTEYTYPYAPGSSVFLIFILFGNVLRETVLPRHRSGGH